MRNVNRPCAAEGCLKPSHARGLCGKHYSADRKADPRRHRIDEDARLRRSFGISIEEYERLEREQDGRCAICEREPGQRKLSVDHDHDTGQVRALLCAACNRALGCMADDPALLELAAQYLVSHGRLSIIAGKDVVV